MSTEPALPYLLTRTVVGLGLSVSVLTVARWTTSSRSNTSSITKRRR